MVVKKTLLKRIDEYNYMKRTIPGMNAKLTNTTAKAYDRQDKCGDEAPSLQLDPRPAELLFFALGAEVAAGQGRFGNSGS
jgi:hypothetical protein